MPARGTAVTLPVSNVGSMSAPGQASRDRAPDLTAAVLFVCTAASIAWGFLGVSYFPFSRNVSSWPLPFKIAAEASPLVFLCAAVLVFFKPRFGCGLGLAGGLIALPWFALPELSLGSTSLWAFLNDDGSSFMGGGSRHS
jgi:hypothetical protein